MKPSLAIVGFEVLTAMSMKSYIFWDMMLCSLLKVKQHYHLFFGPDDGGDMFFQNVS
jgi:hypothetical protein